MSLDTPSVEPNYSKHTVMDKDESTAIAGGSADLKALTRPV